MGPLNQFVPDNYFFSIIIEYFVLINVSKLEYNYCCVVAILISFDLISFMFVQEGIYAFAVYLQYICFQIIYFFFFLTKAIFK